MSAAVEALEGAPLAARQLVALRELLPAQLRALPVTSRAVRAALARIVAASPGAVMPSRRESSTAERWLRDRGML